MYEQWRRSEKKERQDETQFTTKVDGTQSTTKVDGKTSLGLSYSIL